MWMVYRGLICIATPFLRLLLIKRLAQGKEDTERVDERLGIAGQMRPAGMLLWIHGASVGELTAALPLIEALTSQKAGTILVTSGTIASARLAAERLPAETIHQFIPLDHPSWVHKFYNHWKPDIALWLESEFWPNLLAGARTRRIPTILLNARITERSLNRWRLLPGLCRSMMSTFTLCLAPDEDQALRLSLLGAKNVDVVGNLKDLALPLPFDEEEQQRLSINLAGRTLWLAASTHPGEEEAAAFVHEHLKKDFPSLLTIIAPRHPERGSEITGHLTTRGLSCARRSQNDKISNDTDVYVADTLSELGLLYRTVDVVFVGGSLVPHGGQNIAEAARLGCAIVCGPHLYNFSAISQRLMRESALTIVNDSENLANEVRSLLRDIDLTKSQASAARRVTEEDAKAGTQNLQETLNAIQTYFPTIESSTGRT
jgi:3-deoxy-D-manno-octulosonic-acid transferase